MKNGLQFYCEDGCGVLMSVREYIVVYRVCESSSVSLFGPIRVTMRRIVKGFGNLEKVGAEDGVVLKVC